MQLITPRLPTSPLTPRPHPTSTLLAPLQSNLLRSPPRRPYLCCSATPHLTGGEGFRSSMTAIEPVLVGEAGEMIFEPILEDGVFRFDCSADHRAAAAPSLSFVDQKARETPIAAGGLPEFVPVFECVGGQQKVTLQLPAESSLYGTGEVSGQLERTGKRVFTWNTDAWGYGPGTPSLYQSHPWVLAVFSDGKAMGALADTTRRCEIDLRENSTMKFMAAAAYPVITFGPFNSPTEVLVSLSHAIGTVFMPPKWSLGYHQCRFSYDSAVRVLEVARTFREKRMPCDVIWMDIDYMDGFRCFTFDKGLSCQPLSGTDIGGFAGNATPKLFGRWMAVGAMFPFCCGHSESKTVNQEPWCFGEECEEVCRLALLRRYRLLPHIYTLFYMAHTKGTPVAAPTFFADPQDLSLRKPENSFLLGQLLVCVSTRPDQESHELPNPLPRGTWLRFDFGDLHPDLPTMYLQGGAIIPVGLPLQHVGEANPADQLSLIIALDKDGKAEGVLFEDNGDGYEFMKGGYLLTYYVAELRSFVVTVKVSKTEGSWNRPSRALRVHLLLGGGARIDALGVDGEELQILMPSELDVSNLVAAAETQYRTLMETAKRIPDVEKLPGQEGIKLSKIPVELKSGEWALEIVPWIGGRIISMTHLPSGTQWLHSRVEIDGYEEYTGIEYRSAGCSEEYKVTRRDLQQSGEDESLYLEGDIGGGLVLQRRISIPRENPKVTNIDSSIIAQSVGAGSGGFSRLVCLRVRPTFTPLNPTEVFIAFNSIDGSKHEIFPESGEQSFEGNL